MKLTLVHTTRISIIVITCTVFIFFFNYFKKNFFHSSSFQFIQELDGIEEYQLKKNGLKILLMEDHSAPVITTLMTYLAGQREETNRSEEAAHLLEHMVMKSTEHYNQSVGKTAANALQAMGAMMNATTERDQTYYYETFPSEHLVAALDIQADRMRRALFLKDEVEREKEVVRNELERLANNQETLLAVRIWKVAFKKHPYRNAVIGHRFRVGRLGVGDLKKFYDQYYWPNHAVLTIIGDFDKKNILDVVEKKFASIPKSPGPIPELSVIEPKQIKPRMVRIESDESDERVMMAFKAPSATNLDSYALDLLTKILTQGKKCRFYPLLIDQKVILGAGVDFSSLKDPGLFVISAQPVSVVEHREVVRLILKSLNEIKKRGVTESELNRAKKQIKSEMTFARDGSFSIASYVAQAVGFGDWTIFPKYLDRINQVTSEDIRRVAQLYLIRENLTVGFLKSKQHQNRKSVRVKWPDFYSAVILRVKPEESQILRQKAPQDDNSNIRASRTQSMPFSERVKTKTKNGIQISTYATSLKDAVFVEGSFEGAGRAFSSNYLLAGITAGMLDEGTELHTKYELAEILEDLGASVSFSADYKRFRFRVQALKEDIPAVLRLTSEMLLKPIFPKEEFETIKTQMPESIKSMMTDPRELGYGEFKRSIYPAKHPNYEPAPYDQIDQLEKITLEDVKQFYREHYGWHNFKIVVSGDVDESIVSAVSESFQSLNIQEIKIPYNGISRILPLQEKKIFLEGKRSIEIFLGHTLPLHQQDRDYPVALLANHVLGGNFSARLLTRVREEKGLTYSIHSQFAGMADDLEGSWIVNLIAVPELADQALKETKKEISLFVSDGISAEELARNKSTIVGNHVVGLATTNDATHQIQAAEELGLGVTYLDLFPQMINAVTLDQANQAIKKYFKPEHLSIVMTGEYKKD